MIQSYLYLATYTTLLIMILCKVRFNLFLGFRVILFIFEFYFLLKSILDTLFYIQDPVTGYDANPVWYSFVRCCASLANRLKWFILYFFIL